MLPELVPSDCMPMPLGLFQMMTLGWPWPFLWHGQICFLMLLYGCQIMQHWVVMYFQICSNSACPQHSGERYRTGGPLVFDRIIIKLTVDQGRRKISEFEFQPILSINFAVTCPWTYLFEHLALNCWKSLFGHAGSHVSNRCPLGDLFVKVVKAYIF